MTRICWCDNGHIYTGEDMIESPCPHCRPNLPYFVEYNHGDLLGWAVISYLVDQDGDVTTASDFCQDFPAAQALIRRLSQRGVFCLMAECRYTPTNP